MKTRAESKARLAAAVLCASAWATVSLAGPADTAARANAYDDAWQSGASGWVAKAKSILSKANDQNEGMVIHMGDSLRRHTSMGEWVQNGSGRTSADLAIASWLHASTVTPNIDSLDGFALSEYYPSTNWCSSRSMTAVDGAGPWDFWSISGMPQTTDRATAQSYMLNCGYGGVHAITMIAAIRKPQFATVMFNFDDALGAGNLSPDLISLLDYLESKGIVPILIEYPYRTVYSDPQTRTFNDKVDLYNASLESLAQSRGYAFVPFNQEMIARIPLNGTHDSADMRAWQGRFLSGDGVHFTGGNDPGHTPTDDVYADGGNAAQHATGSAVTYNGYGLQGWLITQKMKEIRSLVVDVTPRPMPPQNLSVIAP